ncbi:MAG: hypothetical protein M3Q97_00395 [Bacteroidota bacterium]|nr:hypothetical protein [Bacteroidota bacterium]
MLCLFAIGAYAQSSSHTLYDIATEYSNLSQPTPDGGAMIVVTTRWHTGNDYTKLTLINVDAEGEIITSRLYTFYGYARINAFVLAKNGDYVLAGEIKVSSAEDFIKVLLARFDQAGDNEVA